MAYDIQYLSNSCLLHVDGYKLDKRSFRHIIPHLDRKQQVATGYCFQHSCLPAAYVCAKSSDRILIRPVCALHCTVNSFYHRSWSVHLVTSQKIRKTDICFTVTFLIMFFSTECRYPFTSELRLCMGIIHCDLKVVFACWYNKPSDYHHWLNLFVSIEFINACHVYYVECVSKMGSFIFMQCVL